MNKCPFCGEQPVEHAEKVYGIAGPPSPGLPDTSSWGYQLRCTCGARGPIAPNQYDARSRWNIGAGGRLDEVSYLRALVDRLTGATPT